MMKLLKELAHPTREGLLSLRPWRKHSQVLAVAGVIYMIYGLFMITIPASDTRQRGLELAMRWAPLDVWGVIWIAVGTMAFASTRWPPASETWGYSAMAGLSALWSCFYVMGIVFFDSTVQTGFAGVAVWGLIAYLWWGISGLRNPDDRTPLEMNGAS